MRANKKLEEQRESARKKRNTLYKWMLEHNCDHPDWTTNADDWKHFSNIFNQLTDRLYKQKHISNR